MQAKEENHISRLFAKVAIWGLLLYAVGFAVWIKGRLHLLNASSLHKKVVLEPMTLWQYFKKHPSNIGIRVIRINM